MSVELKPCPFCGSQAHIEQSAGWQGVYCDNEHCFMHVPEMAKPEKWNQRAQVAHQPDEITGVDEFVLHHVNAARAQHEVGRLPSVLKASATELLWAARRLAKDALATEREAPQPVGCREAFEVWYNGSRPSPATLKRDERGYYIAGVEISWSAFQSAWNMRSPKRESGLRKCPYCRGEGHKGQQPCNRCDGSGKVNHYDMALATDFPDGTSLYVQNNEAGGYTYYSDEIGCGVMVWDTALVSEKTILAAIEHYRRRG